MAEINKVQIWPGWETVRQIGRGSFGAVYEIQREVLGDTEKAALKVISIPKDEGDIDELRSDGLDDASITLRFTEYLKDIVDEYKLMGQMKGHSNIVSCDDIRYIQQNDALGWDIYIKMELLTPILKLPADHFQEKDVIRLGIDMCSALILCKNRNIIHRDIKPQNIFVTADGNYKLGDFGISRTMERTTSATVAGTYRYMAPEVFGRQPYGSAVDIYSLGMVLYWLLNQRRGPFLPLPPNQVTARQEDAALHKRFAGEQVPAPVNGSAALKGIVLKACAYDPKDRFASAAEMKDALEELQYGSKFVSVKGEKAGTAPDDTEATVFSRSISGMQSDDTFLDQKGHQQSCISKESPGKDHAARSAPSSNIRKIIIGTLLAVICLGFIIFGKLLPAGNGLGSGMEGSQANAAEPPSESRRESDSLSEEQQQYDFPTLQTYADDIPFADGAYPLHITQSGNTTILGGKDLLIQVVDEKQITATIGGLSLADSYTCGEGQYYTWGLSFFNFADPADFAAAGTLWAMDTAYEGIGKIRLSDMNHTFWKVTPTPDAGSVYESYGELKMTHTDSSLTWSYTDSHMLPLQIDGLEGIEVFVRDPSLLLRLERKYRIGSPAELPEGEAPVEDDRLADGSYPLHVTTSGNLTTVSGKDLLIQVADEKKITATISGLSLADSYTCELGWEHRWGIDFFNRQEAESHAPTEDFWAIYTAYDEDGEIRLDDMKHTFWKVNPMEQGGMFFAPYGEPEMTYTDTSITWTYIAADKLPIRFDELQELTVYIHDPSLMTLVDRAYKRVAD